MKAMPNKVQLITLNSPLFENQKKKSGCDNDTWKYIYWAWNYNPTSEGWVMTYDEWCIKDFK